MGDGGAYSLGFILSFFLISIYQNNQIISQQKTSFPRVSV